MQDVSKKKLVVVLGMHRSGTSAVTRSLKTLGVDLGKSLLPPLEGDNDRGFWEDAEILQVDQDLMKALGLGWCPLSPIEWDRVSLPQMRVFRKRARELLEVKLKHVRALGIKDPRMTRLLPFWQPVFSELGIDISYVLVVRNPLSVVDSLHRRNDFRAIRSKLLWLIHVIPSFLGTRGKPRLVISYERLMADPKRELMRMASNLELPFDETSEEFAAYSQDFLSPQLQRAKHTFADLDEGTGQLAWYIKEVYATLDGMAADRISDIDAAACSLFAEAERYLTGMLDALVYIDDLEEQKLESQWEVWQELAVIRETRITQLLAAIEQYREDKQWLDEQRQAWAKVATEAGNRIVELERQLAAQMGKGEDASSHG